MKDWVQIGEDFQQKYAGTFCRYVSPISKKQEVFQISDVIISADKGPDIVLFNGDTGELFLNYETEAELDFEFPETKMFQYDNKAYFFVRQHQRQWKKGLGAHTASVIFPYATIHSSLTQPINIKILNAAYQPTIGIPISKGLSLVNSKELFSCALNERFSVGCGLVENEPWLWFEDKLIGEYKNNELRLWVPAFEQELRDYMRNTVNYVRIVPHP